MKRRESEFQTRLNRWAKAHWSFGSALVECKVSRGKSLPFSAVSDKQERNLLQASTGFFNYTFSDYDRMGTPADCVFLDGVGGAEGYVAVQFWRPRNKEFFLIPISEWINEKETSSRKSITEERLKELGFSFVF